MDIFRDIGLEVESRWRRRDYNEQDFTEIATDALKRAAAHERLSPEAVYDWMFGHDLLTYQTNFGGFGWEPKITLFYNPRFSIEMLFWVDGTTTIHQHQFEGAFQVFAGSSIHSRYRFEQTERVNSNLLLGRLLAEQTELLKTGTVRPINSGARLLHSLFHLESPSISLLIRTPTGLEEIPPFSYFHPGIALNYDYVEPKLTCQLGLLEVLSKTEHPRFMERVKSFLRDADFLAVVRFLGQLGGEVVKAGELETVLAIIQDRHGRERTAVLAPALVEFHRQKAVVSLRRTITDAEHRLFAAILLNAPNREGALRLFRQFDADSDPVERMVTWVRTLSQQKKLGIEMDEETLQVFSYLLKGATPEEAARRMSEEHAFAHSRNGDIESICRRLAGEPIFQTLFR